MATSMDMLVYTIENGKVTPPKTSPEFETMNDVHEVVNYPVIPVSEC
jgi:hypothetical protein